MILKKSLFEECKNTEQFKTLSKIPDLVEFGAGGTLRSNSFSTRNLRRVRTCLLDIPGKIRAETVLAYPNFDVDFPLFGLEFLLIGGKKVLTAVDLHPLDQSDGDHHENVIGQILSDINPPPHTKLKFYNKFFSKKLWVERSTVSSEAEAQALYNSFAKRANLYFSYWANSGPSFFHGENSSFTRQLRFDAYMAEHDPALGILNAYLGSKFAKNYTENFLFDLVGGRKSTVVNSDQYLQLVPAPLLDSEQMPYSHYGAPTRTSGAYSLPKVLRERTCFITNASLNLPTLSNKEISMLLNRAHEAALQSPAYTKYIINGLFTQSATKNGPQVTISGRVPGTVRLYSTDLICYFDGENWKKL